MITIAKLTIGEAARRRVLWVLAILALVAVGLTTWGVSALVEGGRDNGVGELEIKFAVVKVIHVQEGLAIARVQDLKAIYEGPAVGIRGVLIGDFLSTR